MAKVDTTDLGTKKSVAPVTIYSTAPGGASTVTVSAAAYVPAGTKAIWIELVWTTAAVGRMAIPQKSGSAVDTWHVRTKVANDTDYMNGDIQLDASYAFDVRFTAAATAFSITLLAVYL